jgi:hypothetical protein
MKKILLAFTLLAFTGIAANAQTATGRKAAAQTLVPESLKTTFLAKANALKSALNTGNTPTASQACIDALMALGNIVGNYNMQLNQEGVSDSRKVLLESKMQIGNTSYGQIKSMSVDPIAHKADILSNLETFTNSL